MVECAEEIEESFRGVDAVIIRFFEPAESVHIFCAPGVDGEGCGGEVDALDFGDVEEGEMFLFDLGPEAIGGAGGLATGAAGALGGGSLGDSRQV